MSKELKGGERLAADALNEYLELIRASDLFVDGDARAEVERVCAAVKFHDRYLMTGNCRSEWNPEPLEDGTRLFGSGAPIRLPGGGKTHGFQLSGLLWTGRWAGWIVHHGLNSPAIATGSVWLGVANNSARRDLRGGDRAFAHWNARMAVAA